ncbi:hypothetical protein OU789_02635 [Halocynthiibacter sp. C4]|uniref:hypothetical protein n=1 Tax=Halocynthiibacter sp. C4 TaxID=2992758 RepID=UPI00237A86A8|nr:hypothetical protein [Halocynthiibacter sp. C4]MDE0588819.1 hypothetical protein [Halocynthiibacter sp. C4]
MTDKISLNNESTHDGKATSADRQKGMHPKSAEAEVLRRQKLREKSKTEPVEPIETPPPELVRVENLPTPPDGLSEIQKTLFVQYASGRAELVPFSGAEIDMLVLLVKTTQKLHEEMDLLLGEDTTVISPTATLGRNPRVGTVQALVAIHASLISKLNLSLNLKDLNTIQAIEARSVDIALKHKSLNKPDPDDDDDDPQAFEISPAMQLLKGRHQ